jgi:hypothetical protein
MLCSSNLPGNQLACADGIAVEIAVIKSVVSAEYSLLAHLAFVKRLHLLDVRS